MATLGEILESQPRPKIQVCPKCGKDFYIFHPENECQSVKDKSDKKKKEKR